LSPLSAAVFRHAPTSAYYVGADWPPFGAASTRGTTINLLSGSPVRLLLWSNRHSRMAAPVRAAVFDLAGTVVDHGSIAPVLAFIELFRREGITVDEVRPRCVASLPPCARRRLPLLSRPAPHVRPSRLHLAPHVPPAAGDRARAHGVQQARPHPGDRGRSDRGGGLARAARRAALLRGYRPAVRRLYAHSGGRRALAGARHPGWVARTRAVCAARSGSGLVLGGGW
jgi:hypothetical protein